MQLFIEGFLPIALNNTWVTNLVRRGEGEELFLLNDADLNIHLPEPPKLIHIHSQDICFTRNTNAFDQQLKKKHNLSKLFFSNRQLYCPSCNNC
jgi:hypothetical protein